MENTSECINKSNTANMFFINNFNYMFSCYRCHIRSAVEQPVWYGGRPEDRGQYRERDPEGKGSPPPLHA